MIPSLPRSALSRFASNTYVALFLVFLFVPLAVVAVFAFNDANYPAPPWRGFTLDNFALVTIFGSVCMNHHPVLTRQLGNLPQQITGATDRKSWRKAATNASLRLAVPLFDYRHGFAN